MTGANDRTPAEVAEYIKRVDLALWLCKVRLLNGEVRRMEVRHYRHCRVVGTSNDTERRLLDSPEARTNEGRVALRRVPVEELVPHGRYGWPVAFEEIVDPYGRTPYAERLERRRDNIQMLDGSVVRRMVLRGRVEGPYIRLGTRGHVRVTYGRDPKSGLQLWRELPPVTDLQGAEHDLRRIAEETP